MALKEIIRITNRHIAKTLDSLEELYHIPAGAKDIIKDKMHYLSRDVYKIKKQENGDEEIIHSIS